MRLLPFAVEREKVVFYPLLKERIPVGFEYLAEDFPAFLRIRRQELPKLPLRDHGNLAELCFIQCENGTYHRVHVAAARNDAPIRQRKLCRCGFLGRTSSACFGTLILRIAADRIDLSAVGERKLYLRRRVGRGKLGAQHGAFALRAARRTVECEGNGVEERRLSRAGVARNEI